MHYLRNIEIKIKSLLNARGIAFCERGWVCWGGGGGRTSFIYSLKCSKSVTANIQSTIIVYLEVKENC